ncbi:hypothetical protein DPMN_088709 [Dreissena polymorpha]|uniref:Uncharacterized protein n=1 Tax=Dreissena polymorpha TaxID=45954 RepID=A0A9D4KVH2_DREPO|nr:hypothetical protein DPMN_088709 [Dreissena polymorpha]
MYGDTRYLNANGTRLYVTDYINNRLLTLSLDGTKILHFNALQTGLLLVCGCESNNVVQVDGEAGVVTLASGKDGLNKPQFVYYSARTGTLIVGHISDNILVIHIK